MRTSSVSFFLSMALSSPLFAEPLNERADRIHAAEQQPSESVALGSLEDAKMEFAVAGAVREGGPKPDQNTLYEIGSITKVFTAILLAEAVREGKAKLDDPVGKFLPDGIVGEDNPLRSSITLESLATHTSGLVRIPSNLLRGADETDPYAHYDEAHLYAYLKTLKKGDLEKPGSYAYSNLGFGLLGNVLEKIWGKPYPQLAKEKIFEPLKMESTLVPTDYDKLPAATKKLLATGHNGGKAVPHWQLGSLLGAGAIVSSADDMLTFAAAHWNGKAPAGLAKSLKEVAVLRQEGTGLGWLVKDREISHGGGTGGFRTHLKINVNAKTAEVSLKNSAGATMDRFSEGDFSKISGFWEGTLDAGAMKLRLVRYIGADGRVISFSVDQGCGSTEASKTSFKAGKFSASFPSIGGSYQGTLEGDDRFVGTWTQSGELPLTLTRSKGMPESLKKGLEKKYPTDLTPVVGYWSGYLGGKKGLFIYMKVEKIGESFLVNLFSPDQHPAAMPSNRSTLKDGKWLIKIAAVNGTFSGKLNSDGKKVKGIWNQGSDIPLELVWSEGVPERE